MSDSVRPQRRQPIRLLCPWDSPGRNTGVGCHFLLQCMKVKSQSEVAQLCLTLSDPMDCSLPGSSVQGSFQARVLEWGAIAFSVTSVWDECNCAVVWIFFVWYCPFFGTGNKNWPFSSHVQMWELDHKEGWVLKNWCFWIDAGEDSWESLRLPFRSNQSILKEINPEYLLEQRRQWHPSPVLLLGKSHGWRSLVGCSPWGR